MSTHNISVLSVVMLIFILDIILIAFLETQFHIPSMTFKVSEVYEGEHLSSIVVYEFEYITRKCGMCDSGLCYST
jgi:hypothetical protein